MPRGMRRAAWYYLANDQPSEALTALRMAVALGDNSPPTLLNLALAEEKTGDTDRARYD